jgi:hypothetical protein
MRMGSAGGRDLHMTAFVFTVCLGLGADPHVLFSCKC